MVQSAAKVQVFCEVEAHNYSRYFGLDESKFVWIPYFTDVRPLPQAVPPGAFIFSSGFKERDYSTLFAAVTDVSVKLRVAAPDALFRNVHIPDNVEIVGKLHASEYLRTLTESKFVVVSVQPNVLRHPGVMTYVAAMRLGKCIIVNDPLGASSYIEHGRTGFLVDPSDPIALRAQICALLDDPEMVKRVGANAQQVALERFTSERYFPAVERVVREALLAQSGIGT
jgi:glycosyltransferase involved in cell wall biosynthesis